MSCNYYLKKGRYCRNKTKNNDQYCHLHKKTVHKQEGGALNEGTLELLKEKKQEGQTFIYVCRNKICKLPVKKVPEALQLIQ